jgi:hypothetical protein
VLLLPGAILVPDEPIGSVIDATDEVLLSFDKDDDSGRIILVRIRLSTGLSVELRRSSIAMVAPDQTGVARFRILKGGLA